MCEFGADHIQSYFSVIPPRSAAPSVLTLTLPPSDALLWDLLPPSPFCALINWPETFFSVGPTDEWTRPPAPPGPSSVNFSIRGDPLTHALFDHLLFFSAGISTPPPEFWRPLGSIGVTFEKRPLFGVRLGSGFDPRCRFPRGDCMLQVCVPRRPHGTPQPKLSL